MSTIGRRCLEDTRLSRRSAVALVNCLFKIKIIGNDFRRRSVRWSPAASALCRESFVACVCKSPGHNGERTIVEPRGGFVGSRTGQTFSLWETSPAPLSRRDAGRSVVGKSDSPRTHPDAQESSPPLFARLASPGQRHGFALGSARLRPTVVPRLC